jgi:hypothetical protein
MKSSTDIIKDTSNEELWAYVLTSDEQKDSSVKRKLKGIEFTQKLPV